MAVSEINDIIQIYIKMTNPSQEPAESSKALSKDLCDKIGKKIPNMGVSMTSKHIQIRTKMPNPNQEPPAPFKSFNLSYKQE